MMSVGRGDDDIDEGTVQVPVSENAGARKQTPIRMPAQSPASIPAGRRSREDFPDDTMTFVF